MHSCLCCLGGPPDKDLTTPYTYLGRTEIYSQMLKECFDLQLTLDVSPSGICSACVCRLRDASNFKQQVQQSQAELQARLQGDRHVQPKLDEPAVGEPAVESEMEEDDGSCDEGVIFEPEIKLEEPSCVDGSGEPGPDQGMDQQLKSEQDQEGETWSEPNQTNQEPKFIISQETSLDDTPSTPGLHPTIELHATPERHATHERHAALERQAADTDITLYECGRCGEKFQRLVELSLHVSTVHRKKPVRNTAPKLQVPKLKKKRGRKKKSEKEAEEKDTQMYTCETCGKNLETRGGLAQHQRTHDEKKLYSCEICNKEFNFRCNLQAHERTHKGEKPFSCEVCNASFRYLRPAINHKRIHYTGEKPYSCETCDQQFTTSTALTEHSLVHTGDKPNQCEICDKKYVSAKALKWHRRIHKGMNPYQCRICKKEFKSISGWEKHKKIHSSDSDS